VDLHQAIATRSNSSGAAVEPAKVDAWLSGKSEPTMQMKALTPEVLAAATAPTESSSGGLERTLEELAARIASTHAKQVKVKCAGLEEVPETYRRAVKDITIQLVRNAVVHGIEQPDERVKAQKSETGVLGVEFLRRGSEGFELVVQDDGRGLQLERIKEVAVERGLIMVTRKDITIKDRPALLAAAGRS